MTIQLVPLHNHCINAAKRTIGTFKEHLVTTLATINMLCHLQLWDEFLPQVELTLNLLRFSRRNPLISTNQELSGPFNFNKTPLAPLGTKALVYNDPATQASWTPMLLMVSTWALQLITTNVCISTSLRHVASISPTLGRYILPIAKSPFYPSMTKLCT
jgi:hypothetical protein